ncbi:MAG: ABC transporter ATP-binding protein [Thermaerobacter sp.]
MPSLTETSGRGAGPSFGAEPPFVHAQGISKRFGAIQALDGVNFEVARGEIHVVLGENGAGKTSLMSVLTGLYQADAGEILVDGRPVRITSPADALRLGIAMVPQHVELVNNLTVWENVILGREQGGLFLRRDHQRQQVAELAQRYDLPIDPDAVVASLAAGQKQKVEILKMLHRQARLLILDEPTTYLTPQEVDSLFGTLTSLVQRGMTVILVTHKLRDALRIGNRLTVMRGGRVVAAGVPASETDELQLVRWLIGGQDETGQLLEAEPLPPLGSEAAPVLQVENLSVQVPGRVALRDISLTVRAGEIVGLAGVAGSGQRELAEALVGLLPTAGGRILLNGTDITAWPVAHRLDAGLACIPEDRLREGILPSMPIVETFVLGLHRYLFPDGRYRIGKALEAANRVIDEYKVKTPHAWFPTAALSGGNVQKVIVGRAVQMCSYHRHPALVAMNPTRGLDVRTVRDVHHRLRQVASQGGAVLLVSEDLDELMGNCHRIAVIYQGRVDAVFDGPDYDRYQIGEYMLGRHEREAG